MGRNLTVVAFIAWRGAEQDPQDWWRAIVACFKKLLSRGLVPAKQVIAVCASTQGCGTVPVDKNGSPLMNCITWLDSRGAPYIKKAVRGIVNVAGYDPIKLYNWVKYAVVHRLTRERYFRAHAVGAQ
jgi:xylulokinase